MMVCDICFTPDPTCTGQPTVNITEPGKQGRQEYLFGHYETPARGPRNSRVDLCKECLELLRQRNWDKIAERAQEVLMLRLGVQPHDTSKHNPYCNPGCPGWMDQKT
jgi:hypothetical protein